MPLLSQHLIRLIIQKFFSGVTIIDDDDDDDPSDEVVCSNSWAWHPHGRVIYLANMQIVCTYCDPQTV